MSGSPLSVASAGSARVDGDKRGRNIGRGNTLARHYNRQHSTCWKDVQKKIQSENNHNLPLRISNSREGNLHLGRLVSQKWARENHRHPAGGRAGAAPWRLITSAFQPFGLEYSADHLLLVEGPRFRPLTYKRANHIVQYFFNCPKLGMGRGACSQAAL